jgi:FkbM family methyltransferase
VKAYLPERFGLYVDVGGGHPVIGSNTYLFSKRGFSGIVIEPISKFAKEFSRRPSVKIIQTICSDSKTEIDFFEFEESFVSTTSRTLADSIISNGGKLVSQRTLFPVALRDLGLFCTPDYPSLLDIDVEGADLMVLNSNDWERFRPRVILVECFLGDRIQIMALLESRGYALVETCDLTLVFVSTAYLSARS